MKFPQNYVMYPLEGIIFARIHQKHQHFGLEYKNVFHPFSKAEIWRTFGKLNVFE